MATGSIQSIANRIASVIPPSWFPSTASISTVGFTYAGENIGGPIWGFATVMSWIYGLIALAKTMTRISTATGFFLDLMAFDFFGRNYSRPTGMSDSLFSTAIKKELLLVRGTRAGLITALTNLTGIAPVIFDPASGVGNCGYDYACGYGLAGRYGSLLMPFQSLITAYRPALSGIPNVPGYGARTTAVGYYLAGYSITGVYSDISQVIGAVTDAQIYAAIAAVEPVGVTPWTNIANGPAVIAEVLFNLRMGILEDLGNCTTIPGEFDDLGMASSTATININLGVGA